MPTKVLLKDDGIYVYEDFKNGRAALRLIEFNESLTSMAIRRKTGSPVEMYLVSKAWWDARILAFNNANAPVHSAQIDLKPDDFLSKNLSNMADLILGRTQTKELIKRVALEGINRNDFKAFAIINTKMYWVDDSDVVAREETTKRAGSIKAYLLHRSHFTALASTPAAGSVSGTGNGTAVLKLHNGAAIAETITLTATSATSFTIVASITGALGNATVGALFDSPQFSLLIEAGTVPFVTGKEFVFVSYPVTL